MALPLQVALVVVLTASLFVGVTAAVPRLLRSSGPTRTHGIVAQLASVVVRLAVAALVALGLALTPAALVEHKLALVLAVGATYFAVACADGVRQIRNRGENPCSAR